ncbi:MAG TPA: DUF4124 domain-containing protein [Spongiibacteraceae bacterium]|nr:DUF4124 domain-containing protein [Spongiibacteraceae bacterium]
MPDKTKIIACCLVLSAGSIGIADTVYQSTDKNGNPVFTDQPQPSSKPVELKPTNTTPGVTPVTGQPQSEATRFSGYSTVQLAVPSSIPNGLAPTTIGISIQPQLQPEHHWELLLDGQLQAEGQAASATIEQMARGDHQLQLQIIDRNGNPIGSSGPINIFVYWPSKNR